MFAIIDRLKHKIHNTRIPIKDKRVMVLVQCLYFFSPIVGGYYFMQWIIPDPEKVRADMKPPSAETLAAIEEHKRKLQAEMDEARRKRELHRT